MVEEDEADQAKKMTPGKLALWKDNTGLKLLALMFAIFLWFFVVGEEKAEVILSVPLEITHMPGGMTLSNEFPGALEVRVYGPRSLVRELANQPMSREVDLSGAGPGKMTLRFPPETMRMPRGVQVTRVHPSQITLVLEPLVRREVTVKPVLQGSLGEDYELVGVQVKPPKVVFSGTTRELSVVKTVSTEPIDISDLTMDTETAAYLDLEKYRLSAVGGREVKVLFQVQEKTLEKSLAIPVEVVGASSHAMQDSTIRVTIQGPASILRDAEKSGAVRAVVNLEGLPAGRYRKKPRILAAPGVEVLKTEPQSVRLTILTKK